MAVLTTLSSCVCMYVCVCVRVHVRVLETEIDGQWNHYHFWTTGFYSTFH